MASSRRKPRRPSELVVAMRGTESGIEWWDDLHSIFLERFRVPGCGYVAWGFDRIYDTIELLTYPSLSAPNATPAERSLASKGTLSQQVAALVASYAHSIAGSAAPSVSVVGHSLGAALTTTLRYGERQDEKTENAYDLHVWFAAGRRRDLRSGFQFSQPEILALRGRSGPRSSDPSRGIWLPARGRPDRLGRVRED